MTKYVTLKNQEKPKRIKTAFNRILTDALLVVSCDKDPKSYDNVLFLGHDINYGDLFKAWDDGNEEDFCLYFGVKGDEFND